MTVSPEIRRKPYSAVPAPQAEAIFLNPASRHLQSSIGRRFVEPLEIVSAMSLDDVIPALACIERSVDSGLFAAGFVSYEAGAAFECAVPKRLEPDLPYVWFALYDAAPEPFEAPLPRDACGPKLVPTVDRDEYRHTIERIQQWIAAGDTYQVNYTFPILGQCDSDPLELFKVLAARQADAAHRTFIDTGSHAIISVSPELFFRLDGNRIVTRPMKGTAGRYPDPLEDPKIAETLRQSAKERAENLMIVDLIRNDLGRIAETGSVRVESLFDVERYQTLHTMTSTISATTHAKVPDIFAALFPSGSVTGAPKIRTMQIIDELEVRPRGPYCGAIGWWGPNRQAEFSVGIRTMVIDRETRTATYRVGSGITWDSEPHAEYDECTLKAAVLAETDPEFDLLESMRLENGTYWLFDRHLQRLAQGADYFGYPYDEQFVREELKRTARDSPRGTRKVRLLLSRTGKVAITIEPLGSARTWRVALAKTPIQSQSPFVYSKTTHRPHYTAAFRDHANVDDIILFNGDGELTESTRANLVLDIDGAAYTPPRSAGLLPGTFREELLATGTIIERRLMVADLDHANRIRLVNSVRGWIDVAMTDS